MSSLHDLEKHYDVIVTGTDLTSSLVAAALSRVGKTVLHLDSSDHYGQEWSAMKLFDILAATTVLNNNCVYSNHEEEEEKQTSSENENSSLTSSSSSSLILHCEPRSIISNVELFCNIFDDCVTCNKFFNDHYSQFNITKEVVDRFHQHFYPQLKTCKSTNDARNIISQMKEEFPILNIVDNSFSIDTIPRVCID